MYPQTFPLWRLVLASAGLVIINSGQVLAGEAKAPAIEDPKSWCDLFELAEIYEGEEDSLIQSIALSGRLQADAVFFDANQAEDFDALLWRRFRNGFKMQFLEEFILHAEAEFELNERDPLYERLTDVYLAWAPSDAFELKLGKHAAQFTLDGKTSSKNLIRPERSLLSTNLWFPDEYHTGVAVNGEVWKWVYNAGAFVSSGGREFGGFEGSGFGLLSLGYDFGEAIKLDQALVAVDYVYNDENKNNFGTRDLSQVLSLNGKFEKGKFGVWTDVAAGQGYRSQSDIFAVAIMPFYYLTDKLQWVSSYNFVTSDGPNGVRLDRYETSVVSGRVDEAHEFYTGFTYYFCGHKLKWHNGVEYTTASDDANDGGAYDGWGFTSAIRLSW